MTIENKTNEFRITGGETLKLGRVKFTVREIVVSDDENKTDYDSFDNARNQLEEAKLDPNNLDAINREIE
jgi:hypothetical protein